VKNQKHLTSKIEKLQNKHWKELDAKDQQIITLQKQICELEACNKQLEHNFDE
jgi:hypothetical protein